MQEPNLAYFKVKSTEFLVLMFSPQEIEGRIRFSFAENVCNGKNSEHLASYTVTKRKPGALSVRMHESCHNIVVDCLKRRHPRHPKHRIGR